MELMVVGKREAGSEATPTYTIGDLAREFDVSLRTLRFYEDRGMLSPMRHGTTRLYGDRDRARLAVILKGKRLGFTLTEIRAMLGRDQRGAKAAAEFTLTMDQIESQIAHLEGQRRDIDEALAELNARRQALRAA